MKYVGVRHKPNQTQTYWFEASDEIAPYINISSEVLCDTSRGHQPGTVVAIIEGLSQNEVHPITGVRAFYKNIIGVYVDVNLEDIHVPWEMESNTPKTELITAQINSFYDDGHFSIPVIFTQDLNLHDGYEAYLVARMFEHEKLRGFCTEI